MSAPKKGPPGQPLIPEKYLDVPSQRLYALSLGLLCQAIKLFDFCQYLFTPDDVQASYGRKWLFVDFAYCLALSQLRIPRLNYPKAVVFLQIAFLWFFDGLLFGAIDLGIMGKTRVEPFPLSNLYSRPEQLRESFNLLDLVAPLSFGLFGPSSSAATNTHLLGQHTVRMSPVSTAQLNPNGLTYCLAPPGNSILIPILLNNTTPVNVRYSLLPLGYTDGEQLGNVENFELNARELKAIEKARVESLPLVRQASSQQRDSDEYDEYDDDEVAERQNAHSTLQKSQSLTHIRITKPGRLRLLRVLDTSNTEARILHPAEVIVAPCPHVQFMDDATLSRGHDVHCTGQNTDLELMIDIHGVPPLSLRWSKSVNGRKEHFLVEGIEGGHDHREHSVHNAAVLKQSDKGDVPQDLKIPLAISLDALGRHEYALEEVVDGLGNTIPINSEAHASTYPDSRKNGLDHKSGNSKILRSLVVLRRPTMSFKHCGPGSPTPLLIGSEAPLLISAKDADLLDAPWEVVLKFQPEDGSSKRPKPWQKTLETSQDKSELSFMANAPGEYTILGVKGKYCEGDILAPETCTVVEKPLPTAQIEWKRIHECSGDTGVSAALIFHGTPPFHVYYRTQRDNEHTRELSKTFPSSRGELTLQPERSGHYTYSFVQMSDANYKKVELHGPSIDQVVHPLAAAEFASGQAGTGRNKRVMSSCSGSMVDVDVELKGTGPWNLEVQIVGPKSLETLQFPGIAANLERLQIPIPKSVDKDGGSFDIDLISIEDSYGCKRSIMVPGISVNVRRVKPTAKFYGQTDQRRITILEQEQTSLPLRLTGDGPWRIKYRRKEAEDRIQESIIYTPNGYLNVTDNGTYEILHIMDSQCPGFVVADANTYQVDWVPRPSAKLSPETIAAYESYNGSYILPPICEGMDDHVDLELTGKPPFQIMYNVAQNSVTGGTKLLDQPTFNSIQPRTRFQLLTSAPGRMYYEVKQIGDMAYPLAKHKNAVIPRLERLLFEQEVLVRPLAQFKSQNRVSYCLNDFLTPRDAQSADGLVLLEGTPPFTLQLSIKNLAASHVDVKTVEIFEKTWKLDLPSYTFKSIGPYLITIESVQDASNCAQAAVDPWSRSIWVDVVETAAIIPFDRHENHCVGDFLQFQLEGTPPWTIGYRINGKSFTQEANVSPISLLLQHPGEFAITSIAHQEKMCKAAVTDLRFVVHPFPSAQVAHGLKIFQDIHEGDQAEVVFTLIGEPPFTFTYQRSEPPAKKGKPGQVLETHTVSGVTATEYSIYSASEGTWTVTSISDRYCRYPPAKIDGTGEKQKH